MLAGMQHAAMAVAKLNFPPLMSDPANPTPPHAGWRLECTYAALPSLLHASGRPVPVAVPGMVIFNHALARTLGLDPMELSRAEHAAIFAGNILAEGSQPLAQAYAGHQYGHFTPLGDGRAILLGEQITPTGERFDIQLKGSGPTRFSRRGDGRAALGPMLREYLISEAMHALGIPTTRSLAVVTTGELVYRQSPLPGAVLTRVAASHIRVGTFEWAASHQDKAALQALADYTIQRHYPEMATAEQPYLSLLNAVIERQARLIAQWMNVGFIHGVMNTDNMALSGETIDYGPCAFMDTYDPATKFSSIDQHGRYAYANQAPIAQWNLTRFAETLLPLLHEVEPRAIEMANEAINQFPDRFKIHWLAGMRRKLGLSNEESEDAGLAEELLQWMHGHEADFTNTFRALSQENLKDANLPENEAFRSWHERWVARRNRQTLSMDESRTLMRAANPSVIPRNHKVEEALEAAVERNDLAVLERILSVLQRPYDYAIDQPEFQMPPPAGSSGYETFCGT